MADDPHTRPKEGAVIPVSDVPHAPFIFYEAAPAFGVTNGVVNITLSAHRVWAEADGIKGEQVVTAYLRGNIQAAISLRDAINKVLLLAAAAGGQTAEGKPQAH
jgi:hypothetical protein